MALSKQIGAYDDCVEFFEKALADDIGYRRAFADFGKAQWFQMRCHQCRSLLRQQSKRIYDKEHVKHGNSDFDHLMVKNPLVDDNGIWWIYIIRQGQNFLEEEALSELEARINVEQLQITDES